MWDRLRQIVRSTPGDSQHRRRRREETERETVGVSRGRTVGETRGGTTGRAIIEAMRQNGEQAMRVGHVGQQGAAPSNSHTQSIFSSSRSWDVFRSGHPRYEDTTPPRDYDPPTSRYPRYFPSPPYGTPREVHPPFLEDGRRSTSPRSGSVASVHCNQRNTAAARHADTDSRRQTAARRISGSESRSSFGSIDDTNPRFCTSREALISPRIPHEGRSHSFRAPTRRQNHRYSYGSPKRPRTSSSRDSESVYSSY
ncbi:hypothetical protein BHYA_0369g00050 [Botrytis hyacinthi]|uniref:Uncharacterized protein n=1 Tax=Botrytis hyacinthi TaxID=278943 RepID=A0A4Z1G7S3_9HELO|nr:hypothetical protein BHYA_0369g00050 [Botrytis hyacinthi]